jgi:hypothetical protein
VLVHSYDFVMKGASCHVRSRQQTQLKLEVFPTSLSGLVAESCVSRL